MGINDELRELCDRPFLDLTNPLSREDMLRMEGASLLADEVREILDKAVAKQTVETKEELDALPLWTMIVDDDNDFMEKVQKVQRRRGLEPLISEPFWSYVRADETHKGPVLLPARVVALGDAR